LVSCLALALVSSQGHADEARAESAATASPRREPSFVPTVGFGLSGIVERSRIDAGGERFEETRSDLRATLAVGLAHPVLTLGTYRAARVRIDGHASLGVGPTFGDGRYQVPLREDVTLAWGAASWLTLRVGLGAGVVVDATRTAFSYAEFGAPLSFTFGPAVEVVWRPALAVGLGEEERAVFGGTQSWSSGVAFVPFDFALRFRIGAIGF
jgi:hypothetical protein